jgi:hypothetical protein
MEELPWTRGQSKLPLLLAAVLFIALGGVLGIHVSTAADVDGGSAPSTARDEMAMGRKSEDLMTIEYLYRYENQPSIPDHIMDALAIGPNRAVVASNLGLVLLDLNALPPGGTQNHLYHLPDLNARNLYLKAPYLLVNLHASGEGGVYGFAVVRRDGDTLTHVVTMGEPDAFYEKMDIAGDYLYVAAHNKGIRVFDIADPEIPAEIGRLDDGFIDAFDIAISGTVAYVADGPAGLKIVNVADPQNPVLVGGEDLTTAVGTSQAVTVRAGKVYVAAGSAGLAVYDAGGIDSRVLVPVGGMAEDLTWADDHLVVSTMGGVVVLETDSDVPGVVAREISARRGTDATLRMAHGVGSASDGRLMVANWNYLDVYRLMPDGQGSQPDINSTAQRIRFPPSGGTYTVTLSNSGQATLLIDNIVSSASSFSASYSGGSLLPGERVTFTIAYNGSSSEGSGLIGILSNDPDESPLPIQVFGDTSYLDPGETATDFALPILSKDSESGQFVTDTFTISQHVEQVIWFAIYGSW